MERDRAATAPESPLRAPRLRTVAAGAAGFAVAVGVALALVLGLWLAARDGPSATGQPFRFTPPPEPTAAVTPVTATVAPTAAASR